MRELNSTALVVPFISLPLKIPLFGGVSAGFPSPANDYLEEKLDLNRYLIRNPSATFFVRVAGDSMIGAGIYSGDIAIVDKSLNARPNDIIIGVINGEFTIKRLAIRNKRTFLVPENNNHSAIEIDPADDFRIWGVVTSIIHKVSR